MSQVYGPYTLTNSAAPHTAGTVVAYALPPNARYVRLLNDSFYDLMVKFGGSPPAFPLVAQGDFSDVVLSGDRLTVDLNTANLTSSQTWSGQAYWDGNLYVAAVNNSALDAFSGNITSRQYLWIVVYGDGETPPHDTPAPRAVDLSSQSRLIALPPTPQRTFNGIFTPTSVGSTSPLATFAGTDNGVFYLYGLALSSNVSGGVMSFKVNIIGVTPGAVIYSTFGVLARLEIATPFTFAFPLAAPLYVPLSTNAPGELDTVNVSVQLVTGPAVTVSVYMVYDLSLSPTTFSPIASPGIAGPAANNPVW